MSTILVVDDEELIRKLIRRLVEGEGREVLEAANALEADALMQLRGSDVEVAFMDVTLPDFNGADLASQWVEEYPKLKMILISGFPLKPSSLVAGRMFFLQKPFLREKFQDVLAAAGC